MVSDRARGTHDQLALCFLGPPRIERDGSPIHLNRRKAIALLVYLAVTGNSHRRDSLVNLLWPEYDSTRGRAALRRTLHTLNKALDGAWFEVSREEIGLSRNDDLWVDVAQFRQHLAECESHDHPVSLTCHHCITPLTSAIELASGDFLRGFSLKDTVNFDDWQLFQAEKLRSELAGALERLVDWHSGQRGFELATVHAKRRLALDPLEEAAHRQLMRLYAWSGRRPAALRQYEACASLLEEQLGVPPQEATTQLFRDIQAGQPPAPPGESNGQGAARHKATPPPFLEEEVPVERPVFVARQHELSQLEEHLEEARAGQGKVVFVTGEAGSGKTSLIHEFVRQAQETSATLVAASGNCNAYTGIGDPYLPFREILELLTGDVQARWAAGAMTREHALRLWNILPSTAQALVETGPDLIDTFVPSTALLERALASQQHTGRPAWLVRLDELASRKPPGARMPTPQQSDLFEQYVRLLQSLAHQTSPLLLVVDDLQWADPGSISLLFHLGRHLAGSRILIVGAYRPEDVAIGRNRERHPLEAVVNEFHRDFGGITVDLRQAERQAFVQALVDSEPNRLGPSFRQMLLQQTRGHPLYTIELLRGMQERGDLIQEPDGHWVEGSALDWQILPARIEAVIAERIGRLAQPLRAALRVASVEGEVFTAEVVARVQATKEREVVESLSRDLDRKHHLVRAQALERSGSRRLSRYRFRNYMFQKYLYDSLDEVERAYLHEGVGTVLEELNSEREGDLAAIAPRLAWHFEEAGLSEKAIHYLHQAGKRAQNLSAYEESISHLTRGLALLVTSPNTPERARQELAFQLSLGTAWITSSAPAKEMEEAYSRARELCQQLGETTRLAQVLGGLSIYYYVRAEPRRAQRLAAEALDLAQQVEHSPLVTDAHWCNGFNSYCLGEYELALDHLEQVIATYDPEQYRPSPVVLHVSNAVTGSLAYAALCLWCLGYPDQALRRRQEALSLARQIEHPFSLADVLTFGCCFLDDMLGDPESLKIHAEELLSLANEMNFTGWRGSSIYLGGKALILTGQIQEGMEQIRRGLAARRSARVQLHEPGILGALAQGYGKLGLPAEGLELLDEAFRQMGQTAERHWEAELLRVHAELLMLQGSETEAEASLEKAREVARRQNARSWELRATMSLARLWRRQCRSEEGRQALAEIYGWFTEGFDTPDLKEAKALIQELS